MANKRLTSDSSGAILYITIRQTTNLKAQIMNNLVTQATTLIYSMDSDQLNQIVEAVKLKRTHLAKQVARSIVIGDIVSFSGRRGQTVTGKVTKVNQKTVVVRDSATQTQWKVTASMLTKLGMGA